MVAGEIVLGPGPVQAGIVLEEAAHGEQKREWDEVESCQYQT